MSDYISRDAVEEVLEKAQIISDGENCGYCTQDVNITAIPAADVAPVVRGRWLTWDEKFPGNAMGKNLGVFCSVCGNHSDYSSPYCAACGAEMDEEDEI